jgi:hypothetical protein
MNHESLFVAVALQVMVIRSQLREMLTDSTTSGSNSSLGVISESSTSTETAISPEVVPSHPLVRIQLHWHSTYPRSSCIGISSSEATIHSNCSVSFQHRVRSEEFQSITAACGDGLCPSESVFPIHHLHSIIHISSFDVIMLRAPSALISTCLVVDVVLLRVVICRSSW